MDKHIKRNVAIILGSLLGLFIVEVALNDIGAPTATFAFLSILAGSVKLVFTSFLWTDNSAGKGNKYLGLFVLFQAIWDFGKAYMWVSKNPLFIEFFSTISYIALIIALAFIPLFLWQFFGRQNFFLTNKYGMLVYALPFAVMTYFLLFSNYLIQAIVPGSFEGVSLWVYVYGPVYQYFFSYFQILIMIYALVFVIQKYKTTTRRDVADVTRRYIIAFSIPLVVSGTFEIFLPIFGIRILPINSLVTLAMVSFLFYGLIRDKQVYFDLVSEHYDAGKIKNTLNLSDSFMKFLKEIKTGSCGLIFSEIEPKKLREAYGLNSTPIVWLSDKESDDLSVPPGELPKILNTVKDFLSMTSQNVKLKTYIMGLSTLENANGKGRLSSFKSDLNSIKADYVLE